MYININASVELRTFVRSYIVENCTFRRSGMDAPPSNATTPGPRRKSTRVRRPNVTLDLEGVFLEWLRSKKDARSGFASYVSARVTEITDLLSDKRNLQAVKEKLAHASKAFDNFKNAQYEYWFEVRDEKGSAECDKYLAKHVDDLSVYCLLHLKRTRA